MGSGGFNEVLEEQGPTTDTFFRGEPHWSDPPVANVALIAAIEERLDITLPSLLRELYLRQNGGSTDFVFSAITPDAPLDAGDDFERHWRTSLPDDGLRPVGDLDTMTELQATFDHDPDGSWETYLPGAERLVRIAQQGWDEYLCLDYSDGRREPRVVLFYDGHSAPRSEMTFETVWPNFEAFFSGLRRATLTEEGGVLYRGINPAGPHDQQGQGSQ
ncbi:SMI1/KNR4 family protein [Afifella aestuarii]|uniref:SMI1/KNR4 family protein n=1 Tax=Afifella aestuarii TaxID=1909496 RepID=UPI000FE34F0F|nr:SMI1/KNR4 family protein [Afifella aestuarii]